MADDAGLKADLAAVEALMHSAGPVRDFRLLRLPADVPPWTETGLTLAAGDEVTWLATGRVHPSGMPEAWFGPVFALWGRVGDGPVFKGTQATTTFTVDRAGPLSLAVYQGEWATPQGALATPLEAYADRAGALDVMVIRWRGSAAGGLKALCAASASDGPAAAEAARLASPIMRPDGWHYLWFLGEGDIFRRAEVDGRPAIAVHTHRDVGILQRPVDTPLTDATELAWSWKIDRLPGAVAEDQAHVHDYLSIAVEFDNGQDLTYYWSAALPEGRHFRCPLPTWAPRETHMVIRSGTAGLGRWHDERRSVAADYAEAIGGPPPRRIVGVWLIAVSLFTRGTGQGAFADIALVEGEARRAVP